MGLQELGMVQYLAKLQQLGHKGIEWKWLAWMRKINSKAPVTLIQPLN